MKAASLILVVWEYADHRLSYGLLSSKGYREYHTELRHADQELLPMLDTHRRLLPMLTGVAVAADKLGGFAASRLMLMTLNTVAWHYNIPILALNDITDRAPDWETVVRKSFGKRKHFTGQVLPAYRAPADITPSKKRKKFTVNG